MVRRRCRCWRPNYRRLVLCRLSRLRFAFKLKPLGLGLFKGLALGVGKFAFVVQERVVLGQRNGQHQLNRCDPFQVLVEDGNFLKKKAG